MPTNIPLQALNYILTASFFFILLLAFYCASIPCARSVSMPSKALTQTNTNNHPAKQRSVKTQGIINE